MFTRPRLLPLALMMLGIGGTLWVYLAAPALPPSSSDWRVAIQEAIQQVVPPSAHSCGYVPLGESRIDSARCIQESEQAGRSYWVASQAQGIDSQVWEVVYRSEDKTLQRLSFDSYGWEQSHSNRTKPSFGHPHKEGCQRMVLGGKIFDGKFEYIEPAFSCE